jgi:2-polyprenyl-3-methyl-5-hydroxy-6-metoxy-1,4-benzoquinol methylase
MTRNLGGYTNDFLSLPFERTQEHYRRKSILGFIAKGCFKNILEVGCGVDPLFTSFDIDTAFTVIEPTKHFYQVALEKAGGLPSRKVFNLTLEEFNSQDKFDLIILSSVLHEVVDKISFISNLKLLCNKDTLVYINVPNAKSIHRLLAVSMGIIDDITDVSSTQLKMQQFSRPFTLETLNSLINQFGFSTIDSGTLFFKPFTHEQMQKLVESGFLTPAILDGFYELPKIFPEFGSEIWIIAKINE